MRIRKKLFWYSTAVVFAGTCIALAQSGNTDPNLDARVIRQVMNDALSSNPNGAGARWANPQTHDYGVITPQTAYAASNGQQCRAYDRTWVINGSESTFAGSACKDPEGIWRVQPGEKLVSQRAIPANVVPPTTPPAPHNEVASNQPPAAPGGQPQAAPNPPARPGSNAVASNQPPAAPGGQPQAAPNPPPSNLAPPPQRGPNLASKTTPNQNQPAPPSPPAKNLGTTLSRDEVVALEQYLQRLGLQVGNVKGNFDAATQEAALTFWHNQSKSGQPVVDENFLTLVQIAVSADSSRGGVTPVVVTTADRIGSVPQATTNLDALLKESR